MNQSSRRMLLLWVAGTSACFVAKVPYTLDDLGGTPDVGERGSDRPQDLPSTADASSDQLDALTDGDAPMDASSDRLDALTDRSADREVGCAVNQVVCGGRCQVVDDNNCGACGRRCDPIQNVVTRCMGRPFACAEAYDDTLCLYPDGTVRGCALLRCVQGFEDCDGVAANGCETDITTDQNCGSCGDRCGLGTFCFAFPSSPLAPRCTTCAAAARLQCNGRCVDSYTDNSNCGGCGVTCNCSNCSVCSGGTCVAGPDSGVVCC